MPVDLPPELDPDHIPAHVAIIMDGNGRWAEARGQHRLFGHYHGYRALKNTVYAADDLGVRYLTVYGFSTENWRRPDEEVRGLMELMETAMQAEMDDLVRNGIRVRLIGRAHELPDSVRSVFETAARQTEEYTRLNFLLAINYGGRAEIVDAIRRIACEAREGTLDPLTVDEHDVSSRLYAPDVPDPDLLIRTAGEMRLSNFLLWGTAYSEIWVTQDPWPDFTKQHLVDAISAYQRRTRKFGGLT